MSEAKSEARAVKSLLSACDRYQVQVDAVAGTSKLVSTILKEEIATARKNLARTLRKNRKFLRATDERDYDAIHAISRRSKKLEQVYHAKPLWPRSQVILLVSQFEAFLGRLFRCIIDAKPEIVEKSERTFTFAVLKSLKNIDEARRIAITAEVEAVMRLPRPEKFKWLQRHVGLKLEKEPELWARYVEITERRHCLAHSDAMATLQYIDNCREAGFDWKKEFNHDPPQLGEKLGVSGAYVDYACSMLFEMAAKLTHFVGRVLFEGELKLLDVHLNKNCIYENLIRENSFVAKQIALYAKGLPRHSDQEHKLMFFVNLAIAHKQLGEFKECEKLVSGPEWDVYEDRFKMARAALLEDLERVVGLMKKIGPGEDPGKHGYRVWPLFKWVREKDAFQAAFQEIYGEPLKLEQAVDLESASPAAPAKE